MEPVPSAEADSVLLTLAYPQTYVVGNILRRYATEGAVVPSALIWHRATGPDLPVFPIYRIVVLTVRCDWIGGGFTSGLLRGGRSALGVWGRNSELEVVTGSRLPPHPFALT